MSDRPSHVFAESPNAPRPAGLTLEIADMIRHIEYNYGREGSGPGSRFEGRLLEDVQAEAVLQRIRHLAEHHGAYYDQMGTCADTSLCERAPHPYVTRARVPFADLIGDSGE